MGMGCGETGKAAGGSLAWILMRSLWGADTKDSSVMTGVYACAHPERATEREGTKRAPEGTPTFKQGRQRSPRGSQRQEDESKWKVKVLHVPGVGL